MAQDHFIIVLYRSQDLYGEYEFAKPCIYQQVYIFYKPLFILYLKAQTLWAQ